MSLRPDIPDEDGTPHQHAIAARLLLALIRQQDIDLYEGARYSPNHKTLELTVPCSASPEKLVGKLVPGNVFTPEQTQIALLRLLKHGLAPTIPGIAEKTGEILLNVVQSIAIKEELMDREAPYRYMLHIDKEKLERYADRSYAQVGDIRSGVSFSRN